MEINRHWIEKIISEEIHSTCEKYELDINKVDPSLVERFIPTIENHFYKEFERGRKKNLRNARKIEKDFQRNNLKLWKEPIDLLDAFIFMNLDLVDSIKNHLSVEDLSTSKCQVMLRLHAKACQTAFEIVHLIKGGFADGAMARWRTLYETSVFACFLEDKPEAIHQKFLDYAFIEDYYEGLEYQKNCAALGEVPFSSEEFAHIENQKNEMIKKYGSLFSKSFGWASDILEPSCRNFKGIEDLVDFNHFRSYYKLACNQVHSGSKSILYKIGMYNQEEGLLAGASNYGLSTPGKHTATSLLYVACTLLQFNRTLETLTTLEILSRLVPRISHLFVKVEGDIDDFEEGIQNQE